MKRLQQRFTPTNTPFPHTPLCRYQRALCAYMRVQCLGYRDGLEMSLLLDCEIIPAAARCRDEALRRAMSALLIHVEACDTVENRSTLETRLRTQIGRAHV